jgi:hypothetical protein
LLCHSNDFCKSRLAVATPNRRLGSRLPCERFEAGQRRGHIQQRTDVVEEARRMRGARVSRLRDQSCHSGNVTDDG